VSLLLVDDSFLWRATLAEHLARDVSEVRQAATLSEARRQLDPSLRVVILDQQLPDGSGLSLVPLLREKAPEARILVVTGHPELEDAVRSVRLRIDDYLTKPVEPEIVRHAVLRSLEMLQLERAEAREKRRNEAERSHAEIVGPGMAAVRELIGRVAGSDSPVLIQGETGVGKTLVAKAVHFAGGAREGEGVRPFIHLNCAAIPENLVEAELFGVEKGAFTGAATSRPGLFELADGGTLFLDEIGEMPVALQAKLLGVLEEGQARRVGASLPRRFSVRVLAATHVALETAVREQRFRRDLLYRLSVLPVTIPPLRDRPEDVPVLVRSFLDGRRGAPALMGGEMDRLAAHSWPGNVRELFNVLERAVLLHPSDALRPSALLSESPAAPEAGAGGTSEPGAPLALAEVERRHVLATLGHFDGHRGRTAEALGISGATLRRRLAEYRGD
jgi:two-component system, NtrC family, response regulator AtoC